MAYSTMMGQARGRVVITWQFKDSKFKATTHFASVDEFLADKNKHGDVAWYKILGDNKKIVLYNDSLNTTSKGETLCVQYNGAIGSVHSVTRVSQS